MVTLTSHLGRTTPTRYVESVLPELEKAVRSFFERAIIGKSLSELQWEIAQLPFRFGGWHLIPPKVLFVCGFLASLNAGSDQTLALNPKGKTWIEDELKGAIVLFQQLCPSAAPFVLTPTTTQSDLVNHVMESRFKELLERVPDDFRTLLLCNSQPHASAWKNAPPKIQNKLDHVPFQMLARYSLRVQIIPTPVVCPNHKGKKQYVINKYGDHAIHCTTDGHLVQRHNGCYRPIVVDLRLALIPCSVETVIMFQNLSTYRTDIMTAEAIPGLTLRKTALDFTITNPFASYMKSKSSKEALAAARSGNDRKVKENLDCLKTVGCDFLALSFEATGGCTLETEKCIQYILSQKALVQNMSFSEVSTEFWQSLSITMQLANGRALYERLTLPSLVRLPEFAHEDDAEDDCDFD